MKTKEININDLILADYNPRTLTKEQYKEIKISIEKFGFVEPIVINSNKKRKNIVIGGHQRLKVAKELNFKTVPCFEVSLDEKKEKELNIRLNANVGDWDWDKIANEWNYKELEEWGLNIPVTNFSNDLLDFDENDFEFEEKKPDLIKDENQSANFSMYLSIENKTRIMQVINQVKVDHELDGNEDAFVVLCGTYMENRNNDE
mgnify:CR=1 FL=1